MTSLLRMELLKLVKRPMTWILLILLLGGLGFSHLVGFLSLSSVSPQTRESILRNLTLPTTIPQTLGLFSRLGSIMLAILAASTIGAEYNWGTLRPVLSTGVPRGHFLTAKLVALGLAAVVFMVLAVGMNAVLAVPIALLSDHAVFTGSVDAAWFGDLAAMLGRTLLIVLVPMALAFLFAVVAQSQAVGIGVALGYTLGETVVAVLLGRLGLKWADALIHLLVFVNSQSLNLHNAFGPVDTAANPDAVGQGRALATLLIYGAVCLAASLAIFVRRDVRGAA